ncbi:MAG TPA: hypothetical protein VF553_00240 [Pyrinomonadaceae bacterium]|jgi:hypothetical protein
MLQPRFQSAAAMEIINSPEPYTLDCPSQFRLKCLRLLRGTLERNGRAGKSGARSASMSRFPLKASSREGGSAN